VGGVRVVNRGDPVVVVGDALLDVDVSGGADRLCPDAPVPVVAVEGEVMRPGGAALAAVQAARYLRDAGGRAGGRRARLVTALGGPAGAIVADLVTAAGVELVDLGRPVPTPVKRRVLVDGRSLLRLDHDDLSAEPVRPARAAEALADAASVLVADYGRGVTASAAVLRAVAERTAHCPVAWDPHPRGPDPVRGAALVAPNDGEARSAAAVGGRARPGLPGAVEAAGLLVAAWDADAVAVTMGRLGAVVVDRSGTPRFVPAPEVAGPADTSGAGDAFAARVATALAEGALTSEAVEAGVEAAAAFVAGGCLATWQPGSDPPTTAGPPGAIGWPGSSGPPSPGQAAGQGVIATSGCFDILHAGHVAFLDAARRLGDRLVVLLNSDASVRRLKGPGRPLQPAADRAAVLRSLASVDEVIVFDEDNPAAALRRLRPATFAKGGDYTLDQLPEAATVAGWGGVTVTLPYLDGRSTTRLLEEARNRVDAHP
jgi:rfaE bifunctional protein nucleotidyltransferase chain/domain